MKGIIEKLIGSIKETAEELSDNREQSNARRYGRVTKRIKTNFSFYNGEMFHASLDYRTPDEQCASVF